MSSLLHISDKDIPSDIPGSAQGQVAWGIEQPGLVAEGWNKMNFKISLNPNHSVVLWCAKAGGNGEVGKNRQILFKLHRAGKVDRMGAALMETLQRLLSTGQAGKSAGERNTGLGWDPTGEGFKKVLLPRDNKQLVTYPCSTPYNQLKIIKPNHVNGRRTSTHHFQNLLSILSSNL